MGSTSEVYRYAAAPVRSQPSLAIVVAFLVSYYSYFILLQIHPINIWILNASAFNYASLCRSESVIRRGQDNEVQGTTHQSPGDNAPKSRGQRTKVQRTTHQNS